MIKAILLASLFVSAQAFAYAEKTYQCKNSNTDLPDNTYKIENVSMGSGVVPYVEIVRNFAGKEEGTSTQTSIRGMAAVATTATGRQLLLIGSVQLEFDGDTLVNCRQ